MIDRRQFVQATALLSPVSITAPTYPTRPTPPSLSGERTPIPIPGPMIPPVPAILLSVNGLDNEPDELSVLWTFVVNGKPAQVGVSAELVHRAKGLIEKHRQMVDQVPFFGMTAGSGEFYNMGRKVGHIGQSVKRNDIRY